MVAAQIGKKQGGKVGMSAKKPILASNFIMGIGRAVYGRQYFTKKVKLISDGTLKNLEPPYIVVANHSSFADVGGVIMLTAPYNASFVISVTQLARWPKLIRRMGVLPKKQFTVDTSLIRDIRYVLEHKRPVVIYPEAKLSVDGTLNIIKPAVAKLIKLVKAPLVTVRFDGNYLHHPRWAKSKRFVPLRAEVKLAVARDELGTISVEEIHRRIVENLACDDYAYQLENKIEIDVPDLAEGLQSILYKCPQCGKELCIDAHGNVLTCRSCGATVTQNKYGGLDGGRFERVTDWYKWQTECVREELQNGTYRFDMTFDAQKLVGKRYVELGEAKITHDESGITVTMGEQTLFFKRGLFYTLSFNNDFVFLPTQDAVYRFKRKGNMGCTTKLNIAVEQQADLEQ